MAFFDLLSRRTPSKSFLSFSLFSSFPTHQLLVIFCSHPLLFYPLLLKVGILVPPPLLGPVAGLPVYLNPLLFSLVLVHHHKQLGFLPLFVVSCLLPLYWFLARHFIIVFSLSPGLSPILHVFPSTHLTFPKS